MPRGFGSVNQDGNRRRWVVLKLCKLAAPEDLHKRSAQHPDKLPEYPKDHMPRFMEDEVDPIEEAGASRIQGADDAVDSESGPGAPYACEPNKITL